MFNSLTKTDLVYVTSLVCDADVRRGNSLLPRFLPVYSSIFHTIDSEVLPKRSNHVHLHGPIHYKAAMKKEA